MEEATRRIERLEQGLAQLSSFEAPRNAKLGLAGRLALVQAIDEGMGIKAAAAAFSVSPATAHRWWHRWREASEPARSSLACLLDRSSQPHRNPSGPAVAGP